MRESSGGGFGCECEFYLCLHGGEKRVKIIYFFKI